MKPRYEWATYPNISIEVLISNKKTVILMILNKHVAYAIVKHNELFYSNISVS